MTLLLQLPPLWRVVVKSVAVLLLKLLFCSCCLFVPGSGDVDPAAVMFFGFCFVLCFCWLILLWFGMCLMCFLCFGCFAFAFFVVALAVLIVVYACLMCFLCFDCSDFAFVLAGRAETNDRIYYFISRFEISF